MAILGYNQQRRILVCVFFVFKLEWYLGTLFVPFISLLKLVQINNTTSISW